MHSKRTPRAFFLTCKEWTGCPRVSLHKSRRWRCAYKHSTLRTVKGTGWRWQQFKSQHLHVSILQLCDALFVQFYPRAGQAASAALHCIGTSAWTENCHSPAPPSTHICLTHFSVCAKGTAAKSKYPVPRQLGCERQGLRTSFWLIKMIDFSPWLFLENALMPASSLSLRSTGKYQPHLTLILPFNSMLESLSPANSWRRNTWP